MSLEKEVERLQGEVTRLRAEKAALGALVDAGVRTPYLPMLAAQAGAELGSPGPGAAVILQSIVGRMRITNSEAFDGGTPPRSAEQPKPPAGQPASTANPWKKGASFNMTEQGRITRDNPALANRLRAEAESVQ